MIYAGKDGNDYELPKMTIKINGMSEKAAAAKGDDRFKAEYDFLKAVLPADYLSELLDGKRIDEIDLVALEVEYQHIIAAYSDPVIAAKMGGINDKLSEIAPSLDAIKNINATIGNRQGFSRVK